MLCTVLGTGDITWTSFYPPEAYIVAGEADNLTSKFMNFGKS